MVASEAPHLTVTVRTRIGQVLDMELGEEESAEVYEALYQMIQALFALEQPDSVRSVTFDIARR